MLCGTAAGQGLPRRAVTDKGARGTAHPSPRRRAFPVSRMPSPCGNGQGCGGSRGSAAGQRSRRVRPRRRTGCRADAPATAGSGAPRRRRPRRPRRGNRRIGHEKIENWQSISNVRPRGGSGLADPCDGPGPAAAPAACLRDQQGPSDKGGGLRGPARRQPRSCPAATTRANSSGRVGGVLEIRNTTSYRNTCSLHCDLHLPRCAQTAGRAAAHAGPAAGRADHIYIYINIYIYIYIYK